MRTLAKTLFTFSWTIAFSAVAIPSVTLAPDGILKDREMEIRERYEQALPTLYTSNLPPDRLADSLGGAAVSRLYESTTQLVVTASDYRRTR